MTYAKVLELTEKIVEEKIAKGMGEISGHNFTDGIAMRTMFHTLKVLYEEKNWDEEIAENYIRDMLMIEKGSRN